VKILLTNDDGINFEGIQILRKTLEREKHNVTLFAPAIEKSATSQAMTIYDDIYVKKVDTTTYIVNGFPVDCINIALHGEFVSPDFDLIISGINKGVNMGDDIHYSGTVGAARHAYIHNYPAIAISTEYINGEGEFQKVSEFVAQFIQEYHYLWQEKILLNINCPKNIIFDKKIKWTKLGSRIYRDKYKRTLLEQDTYLLNLGGSELNYKEREETDFEAFYQGFISVTPLTTDGTDYKLREKYGCIQ